MIAVSNTYYFENQNFLKRQNITKFLCAVEQNTDERFKDPFRWTERK